MHYYEVVPASSKYLGYKPLVYCCTKNVSRGQIVRVKFRSFSCNAFIVNEVKKPAFKVNEVESIYEGLVLPKMHLSLFDWLAEYYAAPLGPSAQLFLPSALSSKAFDDEQSTKKSNGQNINLPELKEQQKNALDRIENMEQGTFLLHGITGSGKTRIYLELAKRCLESNRSAIILTPEISLTPQLLSSFKEVFGEKVVLTHSKMTPLKRARIWQSCIKENNPKIILGPRSALFSPISNLGLIVVDECHDQSYKQDKTPFYNALRVASKLSSLSGSKLVMGSATPSINEYFLAKNKNIPILHLDKKAIEPKTETKIQIVDITEDREKTGSPLISNTLIKNISNSLKNNTQSMVFINKRGDSKTIVCQDCSWRAKCARCDLPLTYHSDKHRFSCHTCGIDYPAKSTCENCASTNIIFKSPGTKAIAKSLAKHFPSARVARFDTDNTKAERIDSRHKEVVSGEIDILVGTQLVTKGHDLPRLGLVAMLIAESDLNFPDYSSEERSYQSIQQLMGRVGRGHVPGNVVIQSFNPKNPLIDQAIVGDYAKFYASQLEQRQTYSFPPFYHALKLTFPRASSSSAKNAAVEAADQAKNIHPKCIILGPSPSFYFKKSGKFNWQLIIKSKSRDGLVEIAKNIKTNHISNLDPTNLL